MPIAVCMQPRSLYKPSSHNTSSASKLPDDMNGSDICKDQPNHLVANPSTFGGQIWTWQGSRCSVGFDTCVGADRNMRCDILVSCDELAQSNSLCVRGNHVNALL